MDGICLWNRKLHKSSNHPTNNIIIYFFKLASFDQHNSMCTVIFILVYWCHITIKRQYSKIDKLKFKNRTIYCYTVIFWRFLFSDLSFNNDSVTCIQSEHSNGLYNIYLTSNSKMVAKLQQDKDQWRDIFSLGLYTWEFNDEIFRVRIRNQLICE